MTDGDRVDGAELARQFLEHSPFGGLVGFDALELEPDRARLTLPFRDALATTGDVVHGGAISSLVDTAATLAAWSAEFDEMPQRWGTASLTVNFVRPAKGADLVADARVTRRGGSLCFCEVEVRASDDLVATGLVVYSLS